MSSVRVAFSDPAFNFTVNNNPQLPDSPLLDIQDEAHLCLKNEVPLYLQKTLVVSHEAELKVHRMKLLY